MMHPEHLVISSPGVDPARLAQRRGRTVLTRFELVGVVEYDYRPDALSRLAQESETVRVSPAGKIAQQAMIAHYDALDLDERRCKVCLKPFKPRSKSARRCMPCIKARKVKR